MTTVCLTFDFDALSIWISTFKQTTPTALSRGEYGARVGLGRILALLAARGVPATFFVPAHTARAFPAAVADIAAAGHEVAAHGLVHESPVGLTRAEEEERLARSLDILAEATGSRPAGYRSPAWDLSEHTIELLEEHGLAYDSSLMADDFRPFRARRGDIVSDEGFVPGPASGIVEFPVAWELDDYPYFHFAARPLNQGLRSPDEVGAIWRAEFDWCRTERADGVFTLTTHPEIIGRGPRIAMLGRLIDHMAAADGVAFATLSATAARLTADGL